MIRPMLIVSVLAGLLSACGFPPPGGNQDVIGLGTDRRAILSLQPADTPWTEADFRRNSYNQFP